MTPFALHMSVSGFTLYHGAKEALRHQEQQLDPVSLHERILEDQRHLRDLVLTRNQDRPHIIPRKGRGCPRFEVILM